MKQKSLLTSLLLIGGLCLYTVLNTSYSTGFGSYTSNCGGCHGSANTATTVAINAPTFYAPGQSYPITVTVTNTSNSMAGFQVQTNIGTLSSTDPNVTIQSGNMSAGHGSAKAMSSNTATFNLMWTAPNPGGTAAVFNAIGNAVDGNSSASSADQWNAAPSTNVALPVNFTTVSARQIQDYIEVYFSISQDKNIQSFEIEKSKDGENFTTIAKLTPSTSRDYRYQDYNVTLNQLLYYRIKEVSTNGTITYSEVVSIMKKKAIHLSVYPTLIENKLVNIEGLSTISNPSLSIYNMSGKLVLNQKVATAQVDLSALVAGIYTLAIIENSKFKKIQKITIK